jgi:hypothetical protein
MGRIRKTLRWTFSFGGTGAGSPIRAESSVEQAAREHAELLREQSRLLAEQNRLIAGTLPAERSAHTTEELRQTMAELRERLERDAGQGQDST